MLNFCTLFDIKYTPVGLSMYESLKAQCGNNFQLYIFAFCDESYDLLKKLNLSNATILSYKDLENYLPNLVEAKKDRTRAEYCWTCSSSSIKYCIENYNLEQCTYLDSDLYFYSNPEKLLNEMENKSILITEHRYSPAYQNSISGKYCVQFMSFKNDENGMKALNWWVKRCIEWCYSRLEDNKFGDQKYLDDWLERFCGVHVLQNIGGGVAPWNIQQYKVNIKDDIIYINDTPLVFYHFHNVKFNKKLKINSECLRSYKLDKNIEEILYKPYVNHVCKISRELNKIDNKIPVLINKIPKRNLLKEINKIRKKIIHIKFGKNKCLILFGKQLY